MAREERAETWSQHDRMSDPGFYASHLDQLPDDLGGLARIVQGLLIHADWIGAYGVDAGSLAPPSRQTLATEARMQQILAADGRKLDETRAPHNRMVGTCRDYALMLCALLRHRGTGARVRCGFASYFRPGWEDHWVCEYHARGRWHLADAQLDPTISSRLSVGFDPTDLPEGVFLTAGDAWRRCRAGELDSRAFGHGSEAVGPWFLRVNVLRDRRWLVGATSEDWDTWRQAGASHRVLTDDELVATDRIVSEQAPSHADLAPAWL